MTDCGVQFLQNKNAQSLNVHLHEKETPLCAEILNCCVLSPLTPVHVKVCAAAQRNWMLEAVSSLSLRLGRLHLLGKEQDTGWRAFCWHLMTNPNVQRWLPQARVHSSGPLLGKNVEWTHTACPWPGHCPSRAWGFLSEEVSAYLPPFVSTRGFNSWSSWKGLTTARLRFPE